MDIPRFKTLFDTIPIPTFIRRIYSAYLNTSFMTKTGLGALAVFLVVAGIGGVVVQQTNTVLGDETESEIEHATGLQESQTDLWLDSMKRQTKFISHSPAVYDSGMNATTDYLKLQKEDLPSDVVAIHYVNLDGNNGEIYASSSDPLANTTGSQLGSPWNKYSTETFQSTDVVLTKPYERNLEGGSSSGAYSNSNGNIEGGDSPVLSFVAPVDTEPSNAIVITVQLSSASQRLNAPQGGHSFVVNSEGTIVLSTSPQDINTNAIEKGYVTRPILVETLNDNTPYELNEFTNEISTDGKQQVTGMNKVESEEWVAFTQVPRSVAFNLQQQIQQSIFILLGGVLFSVTFVALLIGIPTIRGLNRLSQTTKEVSDGNYDIEIQTDRKDEIGQVFSDVDNMRMSLRTRINEVEDLNTKLQGIVHKQSEVMEDVANGDLTQEMDTNTGLEALDDLAKDFNNMVSDVRQMVIELEKSEEEMQEFMFIATHDLREPLRMIDTYIDLLEVEYAEELDEEAEEYMDFIINSSDRIDAMIEDLYSYLRAKTHDNEYDEHNLNTIVDNAEEELYEPINESNATINVESLPTVHVDDRQLREVFENLIGNGIQYAQDDSVPIIDIEAKSNDSTQEHIITVSDNGIGIPENQFDKIFEVFSRVERDDNDTGTGIGLAICKRIVEDHGGRIWVESEEGSGTTFHIALPYRTETMQDKFELDRDEETDIDFDEN